MWAGVVESVHVDFEKDTRSYVTIAFGCTGGRHRSVYMAERLTEHCRARGYPQVVTFHRELVKTMAPPRLPANRCGIAAKAV